MSNETRGVAKAGGRSEQAEGGERNHEGRKAPVGADDEMLTKKELAAKLKVSVRCIENWQSAGYLPFLKIASVVLFHWPDVLAHLKAHFQVAKSEAPGAVPSTTREGRP